MRNDRGGCGCMAEPETIYPSDLTCGTGLHLVIHTLQILLGHHGIYMIVNTL